MPTYRAVEVTGSRQFAVVERTPVEPRPGHMRLRVKGLWRRHSDTLAV
jgi:propanol-preferring alcohol dehydrogenase